MAPPRISRTYFNKSKINDSRSFDVLNALFAKNIKERRIRKRRKEKIAIKELPKRSENHFVNDSFNVSTNDTFDKLFSGPQFNKVKLKDSFKKIDTSESDASKSRFLKSFTFNIQSPMVLRQNVRKRKRAYLSHSSLEQCSRLKEKTKDEDRIDISLEIERVRLDNSTNYFLTNDGSLKSSPKAKIFTSTFRENLSVHCSTPIAHMKKILLDPISPIPDKSELLKSYEEINEWERRVPDLETFSYLNKDKENLDPLEHIKQLKNGPSKIIIEDFDSTFSNYYESDISKNYRLIDSSSLNNISKICSSIQNNGSTNKYITLRKRKIFHNISTNSKNNLFPLRSSKVISANFDKDIDFESSLFKHFDAEENSCLKQKINDIYVNKRKTSNSQERKLSEKALISGIECNSTNEELILEENKSHAECNTSNPSNNKNSLQNGIDIHENFNITENNDETCDHIKQPIITINPYKFVSDTKEYLNLKQNHLVGVNSKDVNTQEVHQKDKELVVDLPQSNFDNNNSVSSSILHNKDHKNKDLIVNLSLHNFDDNEPASNLHHDSISECSKDISSILKDNDNNDLIVNLTLHNYSHNESTNIIECSEVGSLTSFDEQENKELIVDLTQNNFHHNSITDCSKDIFAVSSILHNNTDEQEEHENRELIINITQNLDIDKPSIVKGDNENSVYDCQSQVYDDILENDKSSILHNEIKKKLVADVTQHKVEHNNDVKNCDINLSTNIIENSIINDSDYPLISYMNNMKNDKTKQDDTVDESRVLNSKFRGDKCDDSFLVEETGSFIAPLSANIIENSFINDSDCPLINFMNNLKDDKTKRDDTVDESRVLSSKFRGDKCDDSSVVEVGSFIAPLVSKNFKSGKAFRRSLTAVRVSHNCDGPKCTCQKIRSSQLSRRCSIRVFPSTPSAEKLSNTILENYAHCNIVDNHLEDSVRSLSLNNKQSQIRRSVSVVTAKEVVLRRCGQTEPLPFEECYPKSALKNCQKIGEGVYGEVFLYRNQSGGTTVMKVIPIEGDLIINGERQKKFEEILSEIIIAMELSNLRNNKKNSTSGFSEVQSIKCVKGRYPSRLLELWDLYDETKRSENDSPEIFDDNQLYIVLELANGGQDLEAYVFQNSLQAYSMFLQVACSLAVAEDELQFEHRDLHWGNVLLSTVNKQNKQLFLLNGKEIEIETRGVEVAIIDFTLSRIEFDNVVIFNDLSLDTDLFTAEGDHQFEVYRLMQKKNGNNWYHFEPFSNILWLHYILDKAIEALRYKNKNSKVHKAYLEKMKDLKEDILNFRSVKEFVLNLFF